MLKVFTYEINFPKDINPFLFFNMVSCQSDYWLVKVWPFINKTFGGVYYILNENGVDINLNNKMISFIFTCISTCLHGALSKR